MKSSSDNWLFVLNTALVAGLIAAAWFFAQTYALPPFQTAPVINASSTASSAVSSSVASNEAQPASSTPTTQTAQIAPATPTQAIAPATLPPPPVIRRGDGTESSDN